MRMMQTDTQRITVAQQCKAIGASESSRWMHRRDIAMAGHCVGRVLFGFASSHYDRLVGSASPKISVRVIRLDAFTDLLQRRHPAGRQVAVLEQHPAPRLASRVDEGCGLGALLKVAVCCAQEGKGSEWGVARVQQITLLSASAAGSDGLMGNKPQPN
jgi:hypothetical protein